MSMQLFYQKLLSIERAEDPFLSLLIALTKSQVEQVRALTEGLGWEAW